MAASDHLSQYQFRHRPDEGTGESWVTAHHGGHEVGQLVTYHGTVDEVHVEPEHRRRGVATRMWQIAGEPMHSQERTDDGELWANHVGGFVPPRSPWET